MFDTANSYGVIYTQTNQVNGKVYVGQTIDSERRQRNYLEEITKNSGRLIINAMRKYGGDNFIFKIIDHADDQQSLDFLEQMHIERLNSHVSKGGYNLTFGGYGCAGLKRSDEDKQRKREAALKRWASPKGLLERQERSDNLKGIDNPRYGKPGTMLGKTMPKSAKDTLRRLHSASWEIITPNGAKEIITNLCDYCRRHNLQQTNMVQVAKGTFSQHKGYRCKKLIDNAS
jgi:group I intron endonuclease